MIRSEPSFTPYFALIGKDAARLSYLAEVQLDAASTRELAGGLAGARRVRAVNARCDAPPRSARAA